MSDGFSTSSVNSRLWYWGALGTGVQVVQADGRLEMTMNADAAPDPKWGAMDAYYMTSCAFTGDFDTRIDYSLIKWPADSGAVLSFGLMYRGNVLNWVRKSTRSGEELYSFEALTGEWREMRTSDLSGELRWTRVSGVVTAYLRRGNRWVAFGSARHTGPLRPQPVLWASGDEFASTDVTVAFDNFALRAPKAPGESCG